MLAGRLAGMVQSLIGRAGLRNETLLAVSACGTR